MKGKSGAQCHDRRTTLPLRYRSDEDMGTKAKALSKNNRRTKTSSGLHKEMNDGPCSSDIRLEIHSLIPNG